MNPEIEMQESSSAREHFGVLFGRNEQLRYTHYLVGNVEVYLSDEVRDWGVSFKDLKRFAIDEVQRVSEDPFGDTSIDPDRNQSRFRKKRAVNRLSEEIESKIGLPVAIKSLPEDTRDDLEVYMIPRDNLMEQYLFMRQLQFASENNLNEEQRCVMEFVPVYGAVKVGEEEFLIMKRIDEARQIQDKDILCRGGGWIGSEDFVSEEGFDTKNHQVLVNALGILADRDLKWRAVRGRFYELLGMDLPDLYGRNVLVGKGEGGLKKYYIIDQREQEGYN